MIPLGTIPSDIVKDECSKCVEDSDFISNRVSEYLSIGSVSVVREVSMGGIVGKVHKYQVDIVINESNKTNSIVPDQIVEVLGDAEGCQ